MSLDKRVRDALERTSQSVDPDVPRDLWSVRRKTRRAVIRQRIALTSVVAALAALALFFGPRVLDVIRSQRQVPASPPSVAVGPLPGSYRVDLTGAGGSIASSRVEWCGRPLAEKARADARYCSPAHRQAARRSRERAL